MPVSLDKRGGAMQMPCRCSNGTNESFGLVHVWSVLRKKQARARTRECYFRFHDVYSRSLRGEGLETILDCCHCHWCLPKLGSFSVCLCWALLLRCCRKSVIPLMLLCINCEKKKELFQYLSRSVHVVNPEFIVWCLWWFIDIFRTACTLGSSQQIICPQSVKTWLLIWQTLH